MAKASGNTRTSSPSHGSALSAEKIKAVSDYTSTVFDNGKYTDADKASAVYAGRKDLESLYPGQLFITVTGLKVDDDGNLHTNVGINGSKIAGVRTFGQIRLNTHDLMFHVSYEGYSWKTATLYNFRAQYKYIQSKRNFGKWDDKMENIIDKHNVKPTSEMNKFMSIESRYRNKK